MGTKVRIGEAAVLHSGVLLLRDNETAFVEIALPLEAAIAKDILRLAITCIPAAAGSGLGVEWNIAADGAGRINIAVPPEPRWGINMATAIPFGVLDNRPLLFDFSLTRSVVKNVVEYMVLQTGQSS